LALSVLDAFHTVHVPLTALFPLPQDNAMAKQESVSGEMTTWEKDSAPSTPSAWIEMGVAWKAALLKAVGVATMATKIRMRGIWPNETVERTILASVNWRAMPHNGSSLLENNMNRRLGLNRRNSRQDCASQFTCHLHLPLGCC
jgi:hypothetical protein